MGCATMEGKMIQIDPPSLNLYDDPSAEAYDALTEEQDPKNPKIKWLVQRESKTKCAVRHPVTKQWYGTTVGRDNKVVISDELWKQMQKDAADYKASQVTTENSSENAH
jgi:hypothetical protein